MPVSVQPFYFRELKGKRQKFVMLTAYDYLTATLLEECGVELILVGDSLGNVFAGLKDTLPVTMDQMVYHTQVVTRACERALVVADMPFGSYQVSVDEAVRNALRLVKEGGARAVKAEVHTGHLPIVKAMVDAGIPVMAHVGFTPQRVYQLGGYKVQGRNRRNAEELLVTALELEKLGCFAVLLEMVSAKTAQNVSERLSIPVIGIGAGAGCDGQVLVTQDVLGMGTGKEPRFAKAYTRLRSVMRDALSQFKTEVEQGVFPDDSHSFE